MELKNIKAAMKANWKKIALIGGGAILATTVTVVLKNKTRKIEQIIPNIELPRYHEDLCKQIKETIGYKIFEDDVWSEKTGEINMILTDLSTKDIGELGEKLEKRFHAYVVERKIRKLEKKVKKNITYITDWIEMKLS